MSDERFPSVWASKSVGYRLLIFFLVFALIGAAILAPLGASHTLTAPWIYIVLGVWCGLFLLSFLINEIVIRHTKKK
jgi:hypothetical protein